MSIADPAAPAIIAHHGITVRDLDGALEFFAGVLGLEADPPLPLDDAFARSTTGVADARVRVAFVHAPGGMLELLEYAAPEGKDAPPRPCDAGAMHLAVYVGDVAEVVRAAEHLGWRLAGAITRIVNGPRAGGLAAYLHSPDGVTVELVQRPHARTHED